jgi:hypothetical protein
MTRFISLTFLGVLMLTLASGCDRGPKLIHVSGEVHFAGKPLPAGQIFFEADPVKGRDGPQGFAYIKNGKFNTAEGGRGVLGGAMIVRVEGFDGQPGEELPLGKLLFASYRGQCEVSETTQPQKFDVPKGTK